MTELCFILAETGAINTESCVNRHTEALQKGSVYVCVCARGLWDGAVHFLLAMRLFLVASMS